MVGVRAKFSKKPVVIRLFYVVLGEAHKSIQLSFLRDLFTQR